MTTPIQQLQLSYNELHDRLILVLHTQDFCEYRFWITRHALKSLWVIFLKLLQDDQKSQLQHMQETQAVAKQIQEEKAQHQPGASKYATQVSRKPLGEEPLLVAKIGSKPMDKGLFMLHLEDMQGRSIEFNGDTKIILALCQLVLQTLKITDWDLKLKIN